MPLPYTMSRNHVNPQGLQLHGGIELHGGHRVQAHLRRLHGVLLGAAGGEDVQLALPGLIVDQPLLLQIACLLYTSPSPRDTTSTRMPS